MLNAKPSFNDVVGAVVGLVALGVVAYLAAFLKSEQAAGAVIALLAAAAGWLFRSRLAVETEAPSGQVRPAPPEGRNG